MKFVTSLFISLLLLVSSTKVVLSSDGIEGNASNYAGTKGFIGIPTVALPGKYGGRYNGTINGYVRVCADRCAKLPIVDWCYCIVPNSAYPVRIVDLNYQAWALVTDKPLSEGIIKVSLHLLHQSLPDTAISYAR